MRSIAFLFVACVLSFGLLDSSEGAEFLSGESVTIAADETWEGDVYIFAQSAKVEGTIQGDLVVYAQRLHVSGTVEGGVIAAGQEILLEGSYGRTCRIACQAAQVGAGTQMKQDLVAACYSLEIDKGAAVDGDLIYAGYQAMLGGTIKEDVWAAVNRAEVFGKIGRELSITTDSNHQQGPPPNQYWQDLKLVDIPVVSPGLTIHEDANIGGKLTYHSPTEVTIDDGASVTGPIEWIEPKRPEKRDPKGKTDYFWGQLKRYATLLVMGILMVVCCPATSGGAVDQIVQRPVMSFLAGILAVPLAIISLGAITSLIVLLPMALGGLTLDGLAVAGAFVATFAMVLYVGSLGYFFIFGAATITSITLGRIVFSDHPITSRGRLILSLAFGLVFYVVLTCVPYLSVGVYVAAMLFSFGGMFLWMMRGMIGSSSEKATPTPKAG
ncbi:hypothetical protein C5Y96_15670 [Blastopirellula marina]|uniref:Polymer-forming cytoskeletal protein n=1 Tax=Blastopirellula marina TaxID=124 RepID=A0A2S8FAI8_9BACT|nr:MULTISPECIES: hypothetical protein [Pirellulaceae]PQO29186.1 hypothetical protein C5Y96_15670 [Blastopirellula marina]RCS50379.1 hypothetical protein DTL36_15690 [Bremerella cremea]